MEVKSPPDTIFGRAQNNPATNLSKTDFERRGRVLYQQDMEVSAAVTFFSYRVAPRVLIVR